MSDVNEGKEYPAVNLRARSSRNDFVAGAIRKSPERGGPPKPVRTDGFEAGLRDLAARIVDCLGRKENVVAAVCGKTGSGKSEMARQLHGRLSEGGIGATIVGTDDFYINGDPERPQDRDLDLERVHAAIASLLAGRASGDYAPAKVVIVEGIHTIADGAVGRRPDIRAYIEADFEQRIGRRIIRDARSGYRSIKAALDVAIFLATEHPQAFYRFEMEPDLSRVDAVIVNDYREPGDPRIIVHGDRLIFSVDGKVIESRRLTPEEKGAVLKIGVVEQD